MTTNRLAIAGTTHGKWTVEKLEAYACKLNLERWVDPRKPYFVNKRTEADGRVVHFLDRAA